MRDYRDWQGGTYFETVTAAVADVAEHGFDSDARIAFWAEKLREAALRRIGSADKLTKDLQDRLGAIYKRAQERTAKLDVPAFRKQNLAPKMQEQLNKKLFASRNLIKLNREEAILQTERRFVGWATSVPAGGDTAADKNGTKGRIAKSLKQLPFEERRVIIDQGHKFAAALDETIAEGNGAIAASWRSRFKETGYDFRPDHAKRDHKIYLVKGSWADKEGLLRPVNGFTDDLTKPGEEPFCRCSYVYLYSPRALPDDMLTDKGKAWLKRGTKR